VVVASPAPADARTNTNIHASTVLPTPAAGDADRRLQKVLQKPDFAAAELVVIEYAAYLPSTADCSPFVLQIAAVTLSLVIADEVAAPHTACRSKGALLTHDGVVYVP